MMRPALTMVGPGRSRSRPRCAVRCLRSCRCFRHRARCETRLEIFLCGLYADDRAISSALFYVVVNRSRFSADVIWQRCEWQSKSPGMTVERDRSMTLRRSESPDRIRRI
jgi:hypothetical protein